MKTGSSRREFLQTSTGVAGVVLASRRILLDPEPAPEARTPVPASDRLRFGMIGEGMQGLGLLTKAPTLPGAECEVACDLYDGRHTLAKASADPGLRTARRYPILLSDKPIDGIVSAV